MIVRVDLDALLKANGKETSVTTKFELTGTVTLNHPLNCIGLDDIKEKLSNGKYHTESLDARWAVTIGLEEDSEVEDSQLYFVVFLVAIPTEEEIHELSNIWSRSVNVTILFRSKSRESVLISGDSVLIYSPTGLIVSLTASLELSMLPRWGTNPKLPWVMGGNLL
jgi:hypothetical protein